MLICIIAFGYLTYAGIHTQYGDIKTSYIKGVEDIRWGIDIQGGVNATFEPADGYDATDDELDAARAVIEQRLVSLNITDSEVYVDYNKDKVIVSFLGRPMRKASILRLPFLNLAKLQSSFSERVLTLPARKSSQEATLKG